MREILFRGQTRRYGEKVRMGDGKKLPSQWVYGSIFAGIGDFSVIYGAKTEEFAGAAIEKHTVYSDTVGQYTGLKDKNGKRIFEGDILSIPFEEDRSPYEENSIYYEKGEVYFDTERYGWYVRFHEYNDEISLWEYDNTDIEVISNIYDNPELLKGGNQ